MKKLYSMMAALLVLALSFVACENPTPEPEPEPKPEPEVKGEFDVQIGEVTSSTVAYTVTPSDLEAEYLCVLYDAETIEEFTRDQFIVENLMMELESEQGIMMQHWEDGMWLTRWATNITTCLLTTIA